MATSREKRESRTGPVSASRRKNEHKTGFSSRAFEVPEGMKMFAIKKEDTFELDVIPYKAGKGNPFAAEGELYFERTYFVHARVGVEEGTYCCLAKTFKKKCPICEERMKMERGSDLSKAEKDAAAKLRPKERQLWLVRDNTDRKAGVQLWEISFHLFGIFLDKKIKRAKPAQKADLFADVEEGKMLQVGSTEKKGNGMTWYECGDIEFHEREKPVTQELVDSMPCLDDLLIETPYDELKKIFLGEDADDSDDDDSDDDEDEKPAKKKKVVDEDEDEDVPVKSKKKVVEQDEDEDEDEEPAPTLLGKKVKTKNHGVCTVVKVVGDKVTVEDEEGDVYKLPVDKVTFLEAKKTSKKEESEDDEDEDDAPPPKSKKKVVEEDEDEDDDSSDDPTADELGLEVGMKVRHPKNKAWGLCKITHISGDGTSVRVKDAEGEEHRALAPSDLTIFNEEEKPKKKAAPVEEDDDDEEPAPKPKKKPAPVEEDEDDEEPAPKPKKKVVEEDEDDDDEPIRPKKK